MELKPFYISYLLGEFDKRRSQSPNYSLRMFAGDLGLMAPTLSHILNGRRPFPIRHASKIAQKLNMDDVTLDLFVKSIYHEPAPTKVLEKNEPTKILDLDSDARFIAHWEYFAILNYFNLTEKKTDVSEIANSFCLTKERVAYVIDDLSRSGYLSLVDGEYKRTAAAIRTPEDILSQALQTAHQAELDLSRKALQELGPLERDISSITFCGNSKKISQAKKLIRNFRIKLSQMMETGPTDHVFFLAVQLVPLTRSKHS